MAEERIYCESLPDGAHGWWVAVVDGRATTGVGCGSGVFAAAASFFSSSSIAKPDSFSPNARKLFEKRLSDNMPAAKVQSQSQKLEPARAKFGARQQKLLIRDNRYHSA